MDRFTHPAQRLCCGVVRSSCYIARLLFKAAGVWHCQNETEIMQHHMSGSWSKGFLVQHIRLSRLEGALKSRGRGVGGAGCSRGSRSRPNTSTILLALLRTNVGMLLLLTNAGKSSSLPPRQKRKTQSKTLRQLFFYVNACLFHALKPFSPGCLWQTFHNRLFKVWHMCQC